MVGRGEHQQRLLMIAANSSWLPKKVMERATQVCTAFVAPSAWSADVIKKHNQGLPVLVYRHGVDRAFKPGPPPAGRFRAVHLASTHMERKGTRELIHGWVLARERGAVPKDAVLRLVMDGPRGLFDHVIYEATRGAVAAAESIEISQRLDLKVEDMAALYCDHHLVVQPSRAEGFGMVPLEARACGVPVVATLCTGHGEHMDMDTAGVIPIAHGISFSIDDGPGALAPIVKVEDIATALGRAYDSYAELSAAAQVAAPSVRAGWSWSAVTRQFLGENEAFLGSN
jgi:glycosyltransferase involved in cell wall biosynthesis